MKKNFKTYKNNSGFKIPSNYMQDFEAKLLNSLEIDSTYSNSQNKNGFKVPEGYFDTVEKEVLAKVTASAPKGKVIALFSRRSIYYAAAVAAVFIAAGKFHFSIKYFAIVECVIPNIIFSATG